MSKRTTKVTSVNLDQDLIDAAKKLDLNVSKIANEALKQAVNVVTGIERPSEVKKEVLLKQKEVYTDQISLRMDEVRDLEEKIIKIDELLTEHTKLSVEYERSEQIAEVMRKINVEIRLLEFDIEKSWEACQEYFIELQQLKSTMDRTRFESHVNLLRKVTGGE